MRDGGRPSVRLRLTLWYSTLLFAVSAVALLAVYASLAARVESTPLTDRGALADEVRRELEPFVPRRELFREVQARAAQQAFERAVNRQTLDRLQTAGLAGLGGLLVLSLAIGYAVAGRVLAPVGQITRRARELASAAPDLSGRIGLGGPDDELRELADTLDGFLDRIEGAVESQRGFLADASHELRTPIAVARTNLDVVLEDPDADVAAHRQAAQVARRHLDRMGRLVGELLALERGGNRRPVVVDLQSTAEEVVRDLAGLATDRRVELTCRPGSRAAVACDPDDLRRAAANLVENAIVHNRPGGRADVRVTRAEGRVRLEVCDTGSGIPLHEQARVFERLHRATDAPGGSGLGLAIARELMRAADGDVTLTSRPGEGATFTIDLPALA